MTQQETSTEPDDKDEPARARNRVPRPYTRQAFLQSEGILRPTATLHHFHTTRACVLPPPKLSVVGDDGPEDVGGPAWEHIFRCSKTGALRRWGVEARSEGSV